jgi:hypothetical protein
MMRKAGPMMTEAGMTTEAGPMKVKDRRLFY